MVGLFIVVLIAVSNNLRALIAVLIQVLLLAAVLVSSARLYWVGWIIVLAFVGGVLAAFSYVVLAMPDQPLIFRFVAFWLILAISLATPHSAIVLRSINQNWAGSWQLGGHSYLLVLAVYLLWVLVWIEHISAEWKGTLKWGGSVSGTRVCRALRVAPTSRFTWNLKYPPQCTAIPLVYVCLLALRPLLNSTRIKPKPKWFKWEFISIVGMPLYMSYYCHGPLYLYLPIYYLMVVPIFYDSMNWFESIFLKPLEYPTTVYYLYCLGAL